MSYVSQFHLFHYTDAALHCHEIGPEEYHHPKKYATVLHQTPSATGVILLGEEKCWAAETEILDEIENMEDRVFTASLQIKVNGVRLYGGWWGCIICAKNL